MNKQISNREALIAFFGASCNMYREPDGKRGKLKGCAIFKNLRHTRRNYFIDRKGNLFRGPDTGDISSARLVPTDQKLEIIAKGKETIINQK